MREVLSLKRADLLLLIKLERYEKNRTGAEGAFSHTTAVVRINGSLSFDYFPGAINKPNSTHHQGLEAFIPLNDRLVGFLFPVLFLFACSGWFVFLVLRSAVLMDRDLPVTPRNKNPLQGVFTFVEWQ